MKTCTKCGEVKDESEFHKARKEKSGLKSRCKKCMAEDAVVYWSKKKTDLDYKKRVAERQATYYAQPAVKKRVAEYDARRRADPEKKRITAEYDRIRRSTPEAKKRQSEYRKEYYSRRHVKQRRSKVWSAYVARRSKEDPLFKLSINTRGLIRQSLSKRGYTKRSRTYQLLGLDFVTLKNWLEYTWFLNYGTEYAGQTVHVDHVIPCATAKTEDELIALQHWTNLQYLTPEDNMAKLDKYHV